MRNLILGILIGATLTGGLVGAGDRFYDRSGQPSAPRGSVQQFDYFRQRQLFIDVQNLRNATEQNRATTKPCGK